MSKALKPSDKAWRENFVRVFRPAAEAAGRRFKINPNVLLAQAAFESGWGSSKLSSEALNFHGVQATKVGNEFWSPSEVYHAKTGLKFRKYRSAEAAFMDHARLLTTSRHYKAAAAVSHDTAAFAKAIAHSPYISETNGDNRTNYEKGVAAAARFVSSITPTTTVATILVVAFVGYLLLT